MIASGLLTFCHCCALEDKSQVEIISICVSLEEGRMMPDCTIIARLLHVLVLAIKHPVTPHESS